MGLNFFTWLREGVRESVLLGVSDAVENLGTPREGDDVQQRLMSFLQPPSSQGQPPRLANPAGAPRKKLGRTLEQIQASTAKAT